MKLRHLLLGLGLVVLGCNEERALTEPMPCDEEMEEDGCTPGWPGCECAGSENECLAGFVCHDVDGTNLCTHPDYEMTGDVCG